MKKLCIFGGSFDPIHTGHVCMARAAKNACGLDQVLFMPCSQSPLKAKAPHVSDAQRCEMIELALQGEDWACLDTTDLCMPAPSWSWRVVERVAARYPQAQLYWLMGSDQWRLLEHWARRDYLARMLTFIVYCRGEEPHELAGIRRVVLQGDLPVSSTQIRADLAGGILPVNGLTPQVEAFIRRQGLYGCR